MIHRRIIGYHLFVFTGSMFNLDAFVAGVGWLGVHLALLVVPKDKDLQGKGQRPQMKLVETHQDNYTEISADVLSIRGFQEYSCRDYHLGRYNIRFAWNNDEQGNKFCRMFGGRGTVLHCQPKRCGPSEASKS